MACTFIPFCGFCCGCLSFVALLCTSTLLHPFLQTSPPFLLSPHLSPSLDASNTFFPCLLYSACFGDVHVLCSHTAPRPFWPPYYASLPPSPHTWYPLPPCVPSMYLLLRAIICALHCSRLWLPALSVDPVHVSWGVPALFTTCHVSSALVLPVRGTAPLPEVSAPLG